jgi:alpha/beta superfamily hydrolase
MMKEGSKRGQSALDKYDELKREATKLVAEGKGQTLLPMKAWWWTIAAHSMIEMHSAVTLECVEKISCPILALRGGMEDPSFYPVDQMPSRAKAKCELVIIPETDHVYTGKMDVLAATIRRWLASFS